MNDDLDSDLARALLARRTAALAREPAPPRSALDAIIITVGSERFALALSGARAVAVLRSVTPLPHAPVHVLGLTTFGGMVVPVFHLFAVLGVPLTALSEYGRMVVLGEPDDPFALAVNQVEIGSLELPLAPLPRTASPTLHGLAVGVDHTGVILLEPGALIDSPLLRIDIPLTRNDTR